MRWRNDLALLRASYPGWGLRRHRRQPRREFMLIGGFLDRRIQVASATRAVAVARVKLALAYQRAWTNIGWNDELLQLRVGARLIQRGPTSLAEAELEFVAAMLSGDARR